VDTLDGISYQFYIIPSLTEEVILGQPYLTKGTGIRTFSVDLTEPIPEGGRVRQISSLEQAAQDEFISTRLAANKIRPSQSSTAATLLYVPKKDGTLRTVVDYRRLNSVTRRDGYALPLLRECLDRARGHKFYCVIDLENAFDLLRVRPGDEWKTAFKTNQGTFEFLVMPQGVMNGPSFFQRYVDSLLNSYRQFLTVYLDDILLWADDKDLLEARVEIIKELLIDNGINISQKKFRGVEQSVVFLGMMISEKCITPLVDIEAMFSWPTPANKNQLQQFLGTCNWHRDFIPDLSQITSPLNPLTGNTAWVWEDQHDEAFGKAIRAVCGAMSTYNFNPTLPTHWHTDASLFGLGGVMMQQGKVVSIISRGLKPAERNYTTTEREVLAVVHAAKKWRHYLESSHERVTVHTDHQAILQALNSDGSNRRLNRWTELIMGMPATMTFVKGVDNLADAPSRRPDYESERGWEGEGYDYKFSGEDSEAA
jgi:hypothetical protein